MLYETYKKKILKWASARDFVIKHKYAFIALLCAIIALSCAFLFSVGNFTSPLTVDGNFVYGQEVECDSGAFCAKTTYEYRLIGTSSWQKEMPVAPGEYEVRAVAKKAFGIKNYSEVEVFTIVKKSVNISAVESAVTYGESPTIGGELAYNDRVDSSFVRFEDSEYIGMSKVFTPIDSSVKIVNEDGDDVTDYYAVTVLEKTLSITPRQLEITIADRSKVYDGEPIGCTVADCVLTDGTLVLGDRYDLALDTSITEAGSITCFPSYSVTNALGNDVTSYYNINFTGGMLTVNKRPITIVSESAQKVYDATPLSNRNYSLSGTYSLLSGHQIVVNSSSTQTIAGQTENQLNVSIFSGAVDVTANYEINYVSGTLTVSKLPISVTTESSTFKYNGQNQDLRQGYNIDRALAIGDVSSVVNFAQIQNVGSTENAIEISISNGFEDRTSSYQISYTTRGTLTVTPRQISVQLNDETKVYDATPLYARTAIVGMDGLVGGHTFNVLTTTNNITNVGTLSTRVATWSITQGSVDVSPNYEIVSYIDSSLTVTKRTAYLTVKGDEKVYDATPLQNDEVETRNLVVGHLISNLVVSGSQTNVGQSLNTLVSFDIIDASGLSVYNNYHIDVTEEYLVVTHRPISIRSSDAQKEYDGTPLTSNAVEITSGSLCSGHYIEAQAIGSVVNTWDNKINTISSARIYNSLGEEVTTNYQISAVSGELTILPRPITVTSQGDEKEYDGTALSCTDYNVTAGSLVMGESILVTSSTQITDYGTAENVLSYTIVGSYDTTRNYELTNLYGTLSITKRAITVSILGAEKVYDSTYLMGANYEITSGSIVAGQRVQTYDNETITDVGEILNDFKITISYGASDKTFCYDITYVKAGMLVVTPRPITFAPMDLSTEYNGYYTQHHVPIIKESSLCPGHGLSIVADGSIRDVGTTENHITSWTIISGGVDVSSNYNATIESGTIEIYPRNIVITVDSKIKEYDGTPLISTDVSCDRLADTDQIAHVVTDGSQTEAGTSSNNLVEYGIVNQDGQLVNDNYTVTTVAGTLTVYRRELTVTTGSDQKVYDGTPLSNEEFTLSREIPGHTYVIDNDTRTFITDAGIIENRFEIKVYEGTVDVTHQYDIEYSYGTLTVTKREITVTTGSATKIYDETPLFSEEFEVTSSIGLVEGHELYVENRTQIIDVESMPNEIVFGISAGAQSKRDNYEISLITGTLEITQRPIKVVTASASKIYDGRPLHVSEFEAQINDQELDGEEAIISGSSVLVTGMLDLVNVGTSENVFEIDIIYLGVDKTDNYDIEYQYGTLTVTERPIIVKPLDAIKAYDGTPLVSNIAQAVATNAEEDFAYLDTAEISTTKSLTTVGVVTDNEISEITITNYLGEDVTDNYTIEFAYGKLEVTKCLIAIKPYDAEKVYDGTPLVSNEAEVVSGTLPENHTINITTTKSITNFGTIWDNAIDTYSVMLDGEDVTDYFDVSCEVGTLAITQRQIEITTGSDEKIYDGTSLTCETIDEVANLVDGHTVEIISCSSQVDAGSSYNILTVKIMSFDTDVTSNYLISYIYGTLVVEKIQIEFTSHGFQKVYDGEYLSVTTYDVQALNVDEVYPEGHEYQFLDSTSVILSGTYDNEIEFDIVCGGASKLHNYEVTYVYGELIIDKREISIQTATNSKVYDATELVDVNFDIIEGELLSGETTTIYPMERASITDVGEIENVLNVRIFLGTLETTTCYDVTYLYGTLTIEQRAITVLTGSAEKVYDGTELFSEEMFVTSETQVVVGQTLRANERTEILYVGTAENVIDVKVYQGISDKTANYDITVYFGELEITKRSVLVQPTDISKEYDGAPLYCSTATAIEQEGYNSFAMGDEVAVITKYTIDQIVRYEDNEILTMAIYHLESDGDRIDVTDSCYNIEYAFGSIEITQRAITVKPRDESKEYDGTALTGDTPEIISGSLLSNHTVQIVTDGSITEVGTAENNIVSYDVVDQYGISVLEYYLVTPISGELDVTFFEIDVTTADYTYTYDDTVKSFVEYSLSRDLPYGHTFEIVRFTEETNAGEYINEIELIVKFNGEDVTDNFTISYTFGILTIEKRELYITTYDASKVYDGYPFVYDDLYEMEGLLSTHEVISAQGRNDIVFAGSYDNHLDFVIECDGVDKTDNYEFIFDYGTLVITKREVVIISATQEKVYDGYALYAPYYEVFSSQDFAETDTVEVVSWTEITLVGQVENEIGLQILNGYEDAIDSYEITLVKGELTVSPREITITVIDAEKAYDGTPLVSDEIHPYNLPDGHYVIVYTNGSQTEIGSSENAISEYYIFNAEGKEVEHNCFVTTLNSGLLTVFARDIIIKLDDVSKVYDATPLTSNAVVVTEGSLLQGDYIEAEAFGEQTLTGSSENNFISYVIRNQFGEVVDYYNVVDALSGELTVTQREVEIKPLDVVKEYDGTELKSKVPEVTAGGLELCDGHRVEIETNGSQTEIGESYNEIISLVIYDENDNDVTENYAVSTKFGTLTVTQRHVIIVTESASKIYDGMPISNDNYTVANPDGLLDGHILKIEEALQVTDVGVYDNQITFSVFDEESNDVTSLYDFEMTEGVLEITPYTLYVTTFGATRAYNGLPLSCIDFEIDENTPLVDGHVIVVDEDFITTITRVGSAENDLTFIITEGGIDKTDNYNIVLDKGELIITPCYVTIKPVDVVLTYDGTPQTADTAEAVDGELGFDDIVFIESTLTLTDVGMVDNNAIVFGSPRVVHNEIEDVTDCYVFNYGTGSITITKREIFIRPCDATKVYDGTPLIVTKGTAQEGQLCENHTIEVESTNYLTNVGETFINEATNAIIKDADGNIVNRNYEIIYAGTGRLTVVPIEINIIPISMKRNYSGQIIVPNSTTFGKKVTNSISNTNDPDVQNIEQEVSQLQQVVNNLNISINIVTLLDGVVVDAINAGNYLLFVDECTVIDFDGRVLDALSETIDADGIKVIDYGNYRLTFSTASMEVYTKKITISSQNINRVLDEEVFGDDTVLVSTNNQASCSITSGTLVSGHTIEYGDSEVSITLGEYNGDIQSKVNAIDREAVKIYSAGVDVTANYEITFVEGIISVSGYFNANDQT